MPKFLSTIELSFHIHQIIKNADKEIILVTPYLKLSTNLRDSLKDANRMGKQISLIYGKTDLCHVERKFLDSLDNLSIYFHEHLHGKCYFNEKEMLITSMNLHEFSEKQNKEFGILIRNNEDFNIGVFEDAVEEISRIIDSSIQEKLSKLVANGYKSFIYQKSAEEEFCAYLNDSYKEKKFKIENIYDNTSGRSTVIKSKEFIPNVDICITHKIDFCLAYSKTICDNLFSISKVHTVPMIKDSYRIYWNTPNIINLYKRFSNKGKWELLDKTARYEYFKQGIDLIISQIQKDLLSLKNSNKL